jgi:hypothetical protein
MIAFITVCQRECECYRYGNEKSAVEAAGVDRQKSDRVLAEICSSSI